MNVLLDIEDKYILNKYKWHFLQGRDNDLGYILIKINGEFIFLHRFLLNVYDPNIQIDHKNGNKLDYRKRNLRCCTQSQNQANRGKTKRNKSGYKGVCLCKGTNKWMSGIKINNKRKHLGYFSSKEEAALAYNNAAIKYFGEFARLNLVRR